MSRQQSREHLSALSEHGERLHDGVTGSRQIVSPYITADGAVAYLALGSKSALYRHIRENRLPTCRIGRHLRFDVRELDAWIRGFDSALEQTRSLKAVRRVG